MLYMVECAFSDPAHEAGWNDYYTTRKLDEVLAVPGFRTSQRFKAVSDVPSPYLAIHTVDSLEVLTGGAYKGGGGGAFDGLYQKYIVNWHRNLFAGLDRAPAIAPDALLAVCDAGREAAQDSGVDFAWLVAAGLDASTPQRGIAQVDPATARRLAASHAGRIAIYAPMIAQRLEPAGKG